MVHRILHRKKYPSDLTDEPWAILAPLLPPAKQSTRGGRPRTGHMREVLHTLVYRTRRGCPWERLPHDVLPKSPVYDYFAQWRDAGTGGKMVQAWREQTRVPAGRAPTPSALGIESQAVTTTAMGGPERGDDGGKKINGRTRPLLVDTLGVWLAVLMTRAGLDAGVAAPLLLSHVMPHDFPRLVTIVADQTYHNQALDTWMAAQRAGWRIELMARPEGTPGLTPLAKRWGIARTHAWPGRYRRNRKDSELSTPSSTAMTKISNIHLMLNRLCPYDRPAFHYCKHAA